MVEDVINVENAYKKYEAIPKFEIKRLFQWPFQLRERKKQVLPASDDHYVLRDVSFGLKAGESLGIIGENGAGKTTLLRMLAKVTLPTRGRVYIKGRISSLISVGVGFHPDLSGRENIYLNFALMGFNRQQTANTIDQIIEFADLGEYIDAPFKHYSSGMMARLGFSAAIHVDPEIILLDEILGVGDYRFMVKSMAALQDFISRGTLVFVSHDMAATERICKRVIWLHQGAVVADGPASEVVRDYVHDQQKKIAVNRSISDAAAPDTPSESDSASQVVAVKQEAFDESVAIHSVSILNAARQPNQEFGSPDTIVVRCVMDVLKPLATVRVVVGIVDTQANVVITAADNQLVSVPAVYQGRTVIEAVFPDIGLRPHDYGIYVGLSDPKALMPLYIWKDVQPRFFVRAALKNPQMHYHAPQADLIYTPGVSLEYIETNAPVTH